jgi:predicted HAD superfamily Cof-like phosphohydrolase
VRLYYDHQQRVEQFMKLAGQDVPAEPTMPDGPTRLLRAKLILEEAIETVHALGFSFYIENDSRAGVRPEHGDIVFLEKGEPDLVAIADGCADISVVTVGTLSACGILADRLLEVVDESNLAKFRGDAHRREDGKWVKPSDWQPPDIQGVLDEQRQSLKRRQDG